MDFDETTLQAWLHLANMEFPARRLTALLAHFQHNPQAIIDATDADLDEVDFPAKYAVRLRDPKYKTADRQITWVEKHGVRLIFRDSEDYPPLLREISDAPPLLFARGKWDANQSAVGMVGSRRATPYGKATAERIAKELAGRGVLIVSGGAVGIDTAAHRGAILGGGATVAVLGCGLDVDYPRENRTLFEQIAENGAIVSEYPLGAQPETWRFPARNRLISGMVPGIVVVEAPLKSGALITARTAAEQGRTVMTVPGNIDRPSSVGSNNLLRDGAAPVLEVEDVLYGLNLIAVPPRREYQSALPMEVEDTSSAPAEKFVPRPLPANLTEIQIRLMECLMRTPRHIDSIAQSAELTSMQAGIEMTFMEMQGLIRKLPGNSYIRLV